jgi:serine/threonine protein phosphatase PrpC
MPVAGGAAIALAVADGHGSTACFRSGDGAALAVECATALLGEFAEGRWDTDALAGELVTRWREAVSAHVEANPFSRADAARAADDPRRAYGSTILAALAADDYVLYLQLGDGDILIVSSDGEVERPWPPDSRHLGVETTSLCLGRAAEDVKVRVDPVSGDSPALVLLATDGYANSFREDEGFVRVGGDVLDIIRKDGMEKVEASLESWLNEASEHGSGDDITAGLLFRAGVWEGVNGR